MGDISYIPWTGLKGRGAGGKPEVFDGGPSTIAPGDDGPNAMAQNWPAERAVRKRHRVADAARDQNRKVGRNSSRGEERKKEENQRKHRNSLVGAHRQVLPSEVVGYIFLNFWSKLLLLSSRSLF